MGRTSFTGPVKSTAGFEIGAKGSGPDGTNTEVIDGDGNFTVPGSLTVCGTVVGMRDTATPVTASMTVTPAMSGTTFLIGSTTGGNVDFQLPATAAGLKYQFIMTLGNTGLTDSSIVYITPNDADKIGGSWKTNATGSYYTTLGAGTDTYPIRGSTGALAIHDRLTLIGDGSAGWIVVEGFGGWDDKGAC